MIPPGDGTLAGRLRRRLDSIEQAGLRRSLRSPAGLDFSSNDYLTFSQHPDLKERMAEAVLSGGCGSTGSRLLRGQRECFAALERRFADFKETEASLYFSTGYAANLAVLGTLPEEGDLVFSDELNHASLIDGMRLGRARKVVFPHCDVAALERLLRHEAKGCGGEKFLVTESLFSMDGDCAPLVAYADLSRKWNMTLIVDEAHAVGLYGRRGSGLIEETGVNPSVFLSVNTAGKALGVSGAFVNGTRDAVDYLVQRGRSFVFSTAPPPAVAAALDGALDLLEQRPGDRTELRRRSALVRALLHNLGVAVPPGDSPIIPVVLGDSRRAVRVAEALQAQGFDVRAVRPPTVPEGTARLRLSINLSLDEPVLRRFAEALAAVMETVAPSPA